VLEFPIPPEKKVWKIDTAPSPSPPKPAAKQPKDIETKTLEIIVSGGGPAGLIFALLLHWYTKKAPEELWKAKPRIRIRIYCDRWEERDGLIKWKGGRTKQVATLHQDNLNELDGLEKVILSNIDETVWPASKNIPVCEVEDRLLERVQAEGMFELLEFLVNKHCRLKRADLRKI
jgi:hypothetical protein